MHAERQRVAGLSTLHQAALCHRAVAWVATQHTETDAAARSVMRAPAGIRIILHSAGVQALRVQLHGDGRMRSCRPEPCVFALSVHRNNVAGRSIMDALVNGVPQLHLHMQYDGNYEPMYADHSIGQARFDRVAWTAQLA
eukprot:12848-Heterococcus_DN1.PRE.1